MIPSILARQLQQGISDYVGTTFPMSNAPFKDSFMKTLGEKDYLYHEPYVSIRLPFRTASSMPDCFEAVEPSYRPYVHQLQAFERLTGKHPQSTLVATGTGSGKTECFLYPILDYCYHRAREGKRGIKALIIYPMNALASDQSRRIAELIHQNPKLRDTISAGIYVGALASDHNSRMLEDKIITDRETLRNNPPDILLTNYKMLDYLLIRPEDMGLWSENTPETLKFVAVDEFHTFDGAQGTDLACLLRRLKKRLDTPENYLCCIGTSATMGDKRSDEGIRSYASQVFGEPFGEGSVITESRLTGEEFLDWTARTDATIPSKENAEILEKLEQEDEEEHYIEKAASFWLADFHDDLETAEGRKSLGRSLMHLGYFQSLIKHLDGHYFQVKDMLSQLAPMYPDIKDDHTGEILFDALLALISYAKNEAGRPFLNVNIQLWLKELRRLEAKVSPDHVEYALAQELNEGQARQYLPVVNCRDCGATGWASILRNENGGQTAALGSDLSAFYNLFFEANTDIALLYPYDEMLPKPEGMKKVWLCPHCLHVTEENVSHVKCHECGTDMMLVLMPDLRRKSLYLTNKKNHQLICPFCGSERGLSLMGLRSATEISTEISQMFASRFNDDRKLLAFSDNVQDAALRAGFFNARTWRFCLRIAMQQYVKYLDQEGKEACLKDFIHGFIDYWHQKLSDEDFVSTFIAPNMIWMGAYEELISKRALPQDDRTPKLISDIEKRLSYEILLEYGRTSRIGRTLERSGSSALAFRKEDVSKASHCIRNLLSKDDSYQEYLSQTTEEDMEQTVLHFLDTMKFYGAFSDPTFDYYLKNNGDSYCLSSGWKKWRPPMRSGRNIPRFIVENSVNRNTRSFDHVEQEKYKSCIVNQDAFDKGLMQRMGHFILEGLVDTGLVKETHYSSPKNPSFDAYGINEEKVHVSSHVTQMKCDICGSVYPVAGNMDDLWEGSDCPRKSCKGHLHADASASLDYYNHLYNNGVICRINAREHTGLLENEEKNQLEKDFKRGPAERKPFDPNVLSCTPTLEMGIDIGDLDTVVLCSIPPAQAQFLQRCGRAGRKDGNALVLSVANARPHDLYFYADPQAMIDGIIDPPKVFLNASAVLERQLIAYCMDCWVKTGLGASDIPEHIGSCLVQLGKSREKFDQGNFSDSSNIRFPFNFLYYVQNHMTELLSSFLNLFSRDIDESTKESLAAFAKGSGTDANRSLQVKILRRFEELASQEEYLKENRRDLKKYLDEIQKGPQDSSNDDELKDIREEIKGLSDAVKSLQQKNTYGFMADEGLLPNYAFPEEGITLRAVFTRKSDENEKSNSQYKRKIVRYGEYSRSASSAIREFAPLNTFYADGHKMTITQVDVKTAEPQHWRLCPNCSHAEPESEAKRHSVCPVCHSAEWADSGQKVTMLKPQIVYSKGNYSASLIDDENDNRTTRFYMDQMLVDVKDEDIIKAYEMDNKDFPFGYEFARKAVLRQINFGASDIKGPKTMVDGIEAVRSGFRICRFCGYVQSGDEDKGVQHSKTCPAARNPDRAEYRDAIVPCMYLYREFQTEVLRILMPVTSHEVSEVKQESFTAAFMLGMKEYFGNVDHIHATICDVPSDEGPYRKKYLVVYDSVPGGTGYLKQLMENQDSLIQIFQKALSVMENCSCNQDPRKDGCYRCLYAYRQSRNIGNISRNAAQKMIRSILSGAKNIKEIPKLGSIKTNAIFDSELEAAFVEAIRRSGNDSYPVTVESEILNDKEGYVVHVGDSVWELEPQVYLGKADGISVDSKPDFILRLIKSPHKGDSRKKIVVFTDGFTYHWNKADDDTLKRAAIMRSGDYRVWSLSYLDVENVFKKHDEYAANVWNVKNLTGKSLFEYIVKDLRQGGEIPELAGMDAFSVFMYYLQNPDAERVLNGLARAYSLGLLNAKIMKKKDSYELWEEPWKKIGEELDDDRNWRFGKTVYGMCYPDPDKKLLILSGSPVDDLNFINNQDFSTLSSTVAAVLDDRSGSRDSVYQRQWNGFWQFVNVMQFLSHFIGVSRKGLDEGRYYDLASVQQTDALGESSVSGLSTSDEEWDKYMRDFFASDEEIAFGQKVRNYRGAVPDKVGEDIVDEHGRVIGTMTMGWSETKTCFLSPLDKTDELCDYLMKEGWTVLDGESKLSPDMFGGVKQ